MRSPLDHRGGCDGCCARFADREESLDSLGSFRTAIKLNFSLVIEGTFNWQFGQANIGYINVTEIFEGELDFHNKLTSEIVIKPENKKSDKIVGYAAYFKLVSGYEHAEYWDAETVDVHAKRYSQAYRSGGDTPWKTDFEAMACKTVIKSLLSHWGPMSVQMQRAVIEDAAVHADVDAPPTYPDNDGSADPKKARPWRSPVDHAAATRTNLHPSPDGYAWSGSSSSQAWPSSWQEG